MPQAEIGTVNLVWNLTFCINAKMLPLYFALCKFMESDRVRPRKKVDSVRYVSNRAKFRETRRISQLLAPRIANKSARIDKKAAKKARETSYKVSKNLKLNTSSAFDVFFARFIFRFVNFNSFDYLPKFFERFFEFYS